MIETKLNGESKNIISENIKIIKEIFPEVITEDKIDFDKLKLILGNDIKDSNEKYNFTWPGKTQAIKESQKQSTGTLRPCKEESKNWDTTQNLYIEGDNLEVLKLLQKSYHNKVKMIYIDPPYNTGNDFVYKDNYKDNLNNYLELTNQTENSMKLTTNSESDGRYHSNWLNMMYPRLKLARNLLKDDGIIFISIDDNELSNLIKICDNIFGESNFIGQWNWYKSQTPPNLSFKVKKNIEYIIAYQKIKNNDKFKGLKKVSKSDDPITKPQNTIKDLTFEPYSLNINISDKIVEKGIYGTEKYPNELLNNLIVENNTNKNRVTFRNKFIWVQDKLNQELNDGTKVNLSKNLVLSYKKANYSNEVPTNFISPEVGNTTENAGKYLIDMFGAKIFDYPKPFELIEYLYSFLDCSNDIVLDFFSGSATTAQSIIHGNLINNSKNRFILVQIPELLDESSDGFKLGYNTICEVGKERIRRAGDKIVRESGNKDLDIGFKVFKLDSSNLESWDPDYDDLKKSLLVAQDNIKSDRTQEDLVYEIMLKYGVDLTLPIEKHKLTNNTLYSIGCGGLIICLDNNIKSDLAESIVKLSEDSGIIRVVFKDNGFASDSDKTNLKETLKTHDIDEFITI